MGIAEAPLSISIEFFASFNKAGRFAIVPSLV
jgi:hypothetical protein